MASPSLAGSGSAASGNSIGCSPSVALAAGSVIIVYVAASGSGKAVSGVADTQGNTYTQVNTPQTNHHTLYAFQSALTTALAVTDTITGTFSTTSNGTVYIEAVLLPGYKTLDQAADGSTAGSQTSLTVTTAALADANDMALTAFASTFSAGALTLSSGWTQIQSDSTSSGIYVTVGYQLLASTAGPSAKGTVAVSTGIAGTAAAFEVAMVTHSGTAMLSGSGTLQGTGAFAGAAALSGSGTLTWSGSRVYKAAVLSGSGTLTGSRIGTLSETAALSGSGTLAGAGAAALFQSGALSGSGTLTAPGVTLGFQAVLSGTGTLSIIGTGGTVQAAPGVSVPQAYPGTSQVAVAPPGTSQWQYLGQYGTVTALTYSFTCPGGADQLTCTLMVPASYRNQVQTPGWQVRVTRGGHVVWAGKLDEPVPVPGQGWTFTAVGDGNRGTDFRAAWSGTWPAGLPDSAVNNAIARGLPWANAGIGSPAGIWLGQPQDSGSLTITDLLNLACTRGALTWYADSQPDGEPADLAVFPLPTQVNRLLVVTDPVPRTLGGDINTLYIRYMISDGVAAGTSATFGTTTVQNAASVAAHGELEDYVDLSSAGVMSAGAAQAVGNNVLAVYQRASFAGPFTGSYGHLLNAGGVPIDPGTDQAGTVMRPILLDYGYGGEVSMQPVTFITGAYAWDDFAQQFTVTPYQALDTSLSGLLSMESTVLTPITVVA